MDRDGVRAGQGRVGAPRARQRHAAVLAPPAPPLAPRASHTTCHLPPATPVPPPQAAGSSEADTVNHAFIRHALPHLVPLLLEQLTKQEEGQEADDGVWNVSMAAGTCLALCASVAGDAIVPLVMPYVTANIQKADGADSWRAREAATFAFGSILEGPSVETLGQLVQSGLGFLLTALKQDPNAHVKDTTAWTIGAGAGGAGRAVQASPGRGHVRPRRGRGKARGLGTPLPLPLLALLHGPTRALPPLRLPPPPGRIFEFVHGEDSAAPLLGPNNLPQVGWGAGAGVCWRPRGGAQSSVHGSGLLCSTLMPLCPTMHPPCRWWRRCCWPSATRRTLRRRCGSGAPGVAGGASPARACLAASSHRPAPDTCPPRPPRRCATQSASWRADSLRSAAPRPCRPTSRTWCRRCWRR